MSLLIHCMDFVTLFKEKYAELNEEQREAVDSIEGPVMVVAGPGTGKTQILTLRIANILEKTDANPGNILALTFTEAGARAMQARLLSIIGSPAYEVRITTFHGFCNSIIKEYPEEFPRIIGAEHITEVDQIRVLARIIESSEFEYLKPFGDPLYYVRDIARGINDIKREGVSVQEFRAIVEREKKDFSDTPDLYHEKGAHAGKMKGEYQKLEKQIRKNEELCVIYARYEEELTKIHAYDFNDMIMEVLQRMRENENFLRILQEQYHYVLVDEHQDTNNAQNKVLELLMGYHENPNFFVVGDEKQAIYRFQGASLENFLYFKEKYPFAKIIILEKNYRSTQEILDAVHAMLPGKRKLVAHAGHPHAEISVVEFQDEARECEYIANTICEKIKNGEAPKNIAILYRNNRDASDIARALLKKEIPFRIESDANVLRDEDIQKLLLLFKAIEFFGDDTLLIRALHIDFLSLAPIDIYRITAFAAKEKKSLFDVLSHIDILPIPDLENKESLQEIARSISRWKSKSINVRMPEFFESVLYESGFLKHIMKHEDAYEKLEIVRAFFDEIKSMSEAHPEYTLRECIEYFDAIQAHNISVKHGSIHIPRNEVRCMTAHASKGLEFEIVFLVHVSDGRWGNIRRPNILPLPSRVFLRSDSSNAEETTNDDERRLFYVALTRAKKEAHITYASHTNEGKEILPSQFIGELDEKMISRSTKDAGTENAETLYNRFIVSPRISKTKKDELLVRELFLQYGLSVTALNNYLSCPWKYFYTNLLRIPRAKNKFQMYGTAVHGALKDFFDAFKTNDPGKDFLISRFRFYISEEIMSIDDMRDSVKKGEIALSGFYDAGVATWKKNIYTEFPVRGVMLSPEIKLSGVLDKIEILDSENNVHVVDYKTSQPKTRGEIEGATKNSNGDMKRQLVFYKLLLDEYVGKEKFHMVSGEINFVEPDTKGRYHVEQFPINDEETEELKKCILKTAHEILSLSFWDSFCEDQECEFCGLRKIMGS